VLLLLALLQDPLQDPASGWKNFRPGSWVRLKTTTAIDGGKPMPGETRITLVELGKEKLVLETETTVLRETRKERKEIALKADPKKPKPRVKEIKRGEEELEIGGKKLKCRFVENEIESDEGGATARSTVRMWMSDEIPGGLAKLEASVVQPSASSMTFEAVAYEKK
jgi:hypothetical protein